MSTPADTTVDELIAGAPRVWGLVWPIPPDVDDDEGRQIVLQSGIAVWQEGLLRQGLLPLRPPSCELVSAVLVGSRLERFVDDPADDAGVPVWLIKGLVNR